ncbi:MAG TPA: TIGR03619 family F420-dependent LLM class oxidoreductase, partial [Gaiellaceae bacterium]|nr:TIGR03619 family F420-dependent LLM class oxidoreductase [Gaiellaceae bacterium]
MPDPAVFREVAARAEELGYDSIWAGDHISYRNPILDIVVALSTFAAVTERITLGAGIVLLPLRHPSVVAKEFASLDYVSGGRVILGVGVGGEGAKDFEAVGVPVRERGARTDEALRALRALFGEQQASFGGRFFSFDGISIEPRPAQPGGPPLWVGGRSEAALRRAATLGDGWIP